jgi:lipoprotein-anchoring transpeptidase ErfK/SrfK
MLRLVGLLGLWLLALGTTAEAQFWGSPYDRRYSDYRPSYRAFPGYRSYNWWNNDDDDDDDFYRSRPQGPSQQSGGPRPAITPIPPASINFPSSYPVGSIVIDTRGRRLYLIQSLTTALVYQISVGREGFAWTGTEKISRKAEWPDWYPPQEMRERDWRLPEKMTGGIKNPLGAMALYLGNSLYRIHGTNDAKSIGQAASSGCFRMLNGHIVDLASRVEVGTQVTVVHRLPADLDRIVAQQLGDGRLRASSESGRF